jgi:dihydroorotase-like cyclic amidohydrolase
MDLIVSHGRVVTPEAVLEDHDVGVAGGKIVAVGPTGTLPAAARTIDAQRRYVLPGLIDPHTHPGNFRPFELDVRSTSRSAAAGGITTVFGTVKATRLARPFHAIARPADVVSYSKVFDAGRASVERESLVDMGFSFTIATLEQAKEVPHYASELGVRSFKFHPAAHLGPWHRKIGVPLAADDGTIFTALEGVARVGGLAMVHAENGQISNVLRTRMQAEGRTGLLAWNDASPDFIEASEIRWMAYFCRIVGCPLYIAHLTSKRALDAVREARSLGVTVIVETCPQWLLHTADDDPDNVLLKYTPPLRRPEDRDELWRALASGEIQCVGTDHVPNSLAVKRGTDFWNALVGSAGTETMLPALMSEGVHRGRIDIRRLAQVLSTTTARAFGVYPRKGLIAPGSDADLTIVDADLERVVRIAELVSRAETDWSPLEGRTLRGWPVLTIRAGEVIAKDGKALRAKPGKYLLRQSPIEVTELAS